MGGRLLGRTWLVCGLGFLIMLAGARSVQAQACENYCSPSVSCSARCIVDPQDWPRVWTTCGQWGVCASCTPNWQTVATQPVLVHVNTTEAGNPACQTWRMTRVTQHDANQCNPNNLERHYCAGTPQWIQTVFFTCCGHGCHPEVDDSACH
jgi:hypothetical protein